MEIVIRKQMVSNWNQHRDNLISLIPNLGQKNNLSTYVSTDQDNNFVFEEDGDHETDYFHEQGWHHTDFLEDGVPRYQGVVKDLITPIIKEFLGDQGFEIVKMWYSRQRRGEGHPHHDHGAIGFASVLYVKFNPEVHSPTEYIFPRASQATSLPVEEGEFVMFPSKLKHQAPPNKSDEERIIVAMNIAVDN